jgi:hypothetical protein
VWGAKFTCECTLSGDLSLLWWGLAESAVPSIRSFLRLVGAALKLEENIYA